MIGGFSWVDLVWLAALTVRLQVSDYSQLSITLSDYNCTEGLVIHKAADAPITFKEIVKVMSKIDRDVVLNTRREISYLRATMYYFVYHINIIALYWQEKPTTLMDEDKSGIDNPRITIVECVGANSKDGEMRRIMITKSMVVIFNLQNSHLLTLFLPTEEVFPVSGQNRPMTNLPVVDFYSQPGEIPTPKPLNT